MLIADDLNKLLEIDDFIVHTLIGVTAGIFLPLAALQIINLIKLRYIFIP